MSKEKMIQLLPFVFILFLLLCGSYELIYTHYWLLTTFHISVFPFLLMLFIFFFFIIFKYTKTYFVAKHQCTTYFVGFLVFYLLYHLLYSLCFLFITLFIPLPFFITSNLVVLFTLITFIVGFIQSKQIHIVHEHIPLSKKDYSIVLLSDLHIGYYIQKHHIQQVVEKVNALSADAIVIAGDIINCQNTLECPQLTEVSQLLAQLQSKDGTFAIIGNHDPDHANPDFLKFLKASKIVLVDDAILHLQDIDFLCRSTITKPRKPMSQFSPHQPYIIVDHDPIGIKDALTYHANAIFCGHTHAGQFFPFSWIVKKYYGKEGFHGHHKIANTDIIVSAGSGYFSVPIRLGSRCEIIKINLKKGN